MNDEETSKKAICGCTGPHHCGIDFGSQISQIPPIKNDLILDCVNADLPHTGHERELHAKATEYLEAVHRVVGYNREIDAKAQKLLKDRIDLNQKIDDKIKTLELDYGVYTLNGGQVHAECISKQIELLKWVKS